MKYDANGRSQSHIKHALLISHTQNADVVSCDMLNMTYDRSWQAKVATPIAQLMCS